MSLWGNDGFAVVMFSSSYIRCAVFSRTKSGWVLSAHTSEELGSGDRSEILRKVLNRLNCSKAVPLFVCGSFRGGIFFQTESVDLPIAEQRAALELELPRHLIEIPKENRMQFFTFERGDDKVCVNAYIFPAVSIGAVAESLTGCGWQSDGFIYPLMAYRDGDPLFFNDEIEPGFGFSDGQWRPFSDGAEYDKSLVDWRDVLEEVFTLPSDLDFKSFLPLLLTARLAADKEYQSKKQGLFVLPGNLRPKRIRRQLQLTVILFVSLIAMLIWGASGSWNKNRREYNELKTQIQRMTRQTTSIQNQLRRQNRINKERAKISGIKSGERDVLAFIAAFSSLLPENVSVSNFRLNESGVDLVLASEVENLDLARVLKPMGDWKISQLQQRQNRRGSGNTVTLKLVPATGAEKKKGRRR